MNASPAATAIWGGLICHDPTSLWQSPSANTDVVCSEHPIFLFTVAAYPNAKKNFYLLGLACQANLVFSHLTSPPLASALIPIQVFNLLMPSCLSSLYRLADVPLNLVVWFNHPIAYTFHQMRLHQSAIFMALCFLQHLKARFPMARGSSGHHLLISTFMLSNDHLQQHIFQQVVVYCQSRHVRSLQS